MKTSKAALALALIALFAALFAWRVVAYDVPAISPEACHTGGIATELQEHGLRFPLRAYTPEGYENGIVIAGLLASVWTAIVGHSVLSFQLFAHVFAFAGELAAVLLLGRALDDLGVRRTAPRRIAYAAFLLLVAVAPPFFAMKMLDPLGDHNEGAAFGLVVLWLFARRRERPESRWRFAALWLFAGVLTMWEKGVAMAVAIALLDEMLSVVRRSRPLRTLPTAALWLAVGYSPAIAVHLATGLSDVGVVASKFGDLAHATSRLALQAKLTGAPLATVALLLAGVGGWVFVARRTLSRPSLPHYLALYVVAHLALAMTGRSATPSYFLYGFPLWAMSAALLLALAWNAPARLPRALATAAAVALVALHVRALHPDVRRFGELVSDRDSGVCSWRFGRAFVLSSKTPSAAVERCRVLADDRALECVSGVPFGVADRPSNVGVGSREGLALAFGAGRAGVSWSGATPCTSFVDPAEQAACERGRRWECIAYADLVDRLLGQAPLGAPACDVDAPFEAPRFRASARAWAARPRLSYDPGRLGNPACKPTFDECFADAR